MWPPRGEWKGFAPEGTESLLPLAVEGPPHILDGREAGDCIAEPENRGLPGPVEKVDEVGVL